MKARRGPFLAILLAFSGVFAAAQSPTRETYNVLATPLDDLSRELLVETGYVIREDGKVWDKIADNAVRLDEMSYLLSRLAGARRLKALLELNLILNRSDGEKRLTATEREAVRTILRKHWTVFGVGTRKDFRSYFSVQELTEELDKIPARFDRGSALLMRDPDPNTVQSMPLAVAPISVTALPPTAIDAPVPISPPVPESIATSEAPRQFIPRSVLTPFLEPLSLRRPSPFAPRVKPAVIAVTVAPVAQTTVPAPETYVAGKAPSSPVIAGPIAALMSAMTPLPAPAPMVFAPQTSPSPPPPMRAPEPSTLPAPIVAQALPPAMPAALPLIAPLWAPAPTAVTSAPPTAPKARAPIPLPNAVTPSNSLFGTPPPIVPTPTIAGDLGMLKPWVAPNASASPEQIPQTAAQGLAPVAAPTMKPAIIAAPIVQAPPAPADATAAEFDAFVANGPYGREGQHLLKMLAEKAPEFCRAILRRTVVRGAPLIVIDGSRAGSDRRAGFAPAEPGHPGVTIALSAGPLLIERKKGMFAKTVIALPEDPRAWAELGIAPPMLDALKKDTAPSSQENGPWGAVRAFPDRSRRGTYSPQEQAGELLERLLLLGLEREGFASSTYAARAWARAARLLFTARVAEDYGNDSFLDPDRRIELRDWIERGDESDDIMIASWSSSRGNVLDPRRGGPMAQALYERKARESCTRSLLADHLAEAARNLAARVRTLEALNENDLLSSAAAKVAAQKAANEESAARAALLAAPPACDGRFGADEAGLHRSAALLAEVSRAERAFRERKSKGVAE